MQTQKVFQAGNSSVVAIPKNLLQDLKLRKGQKVTVERTPDGDAIVIKKAVTKSVKTEGIGAKTSLTPEFKQWLDKFVIEYKDVLDDLAKL